MQKHPTYCLVLTQAQPIPLSTPPPLGGHLFQMMKYIIGTALSFEVYNLHWGSLSIVHFVDLDKCIMVCMCHNRIRLSFPVLKFLCVPPIYSLLLDDAWSFYYLHSFVYWNHTVYTLFTLASFNSFKCPPQLFRAW